MKWIKVTDELPPYEEEVQLYGKIYYCSTNPMVADSITKSIFIGRRVCTDVLGEKFRIECMNKRAIYCFKKAYNGFEKDIEVTHWARLLPPPEEE